uniref:(northern house mosquito) hypothetical protein n=1 Tax=Culex pipiens TaxID=7175 RepID=A0A8D8FVT0_CULPI
MVSFPVSVFNLLQHVHPTQLFAQFLKCKISLCVIHGCHRTQTSKRPFHMLTSVVGNQELLWMTTIAAATDSKHKAMGVELETSVRVGRYALRICSFMPQCPIPPSPHEE